MIKLAIRFIPETNSIDVVCDKECRISKKNFDELIEMALSHPWTLCHIDERRD